MIDRLAALGARFRAAAAIARRPVHSLVREALGLRLGGLRLGVSEYLDFRLYENDLSQAQKRAFGPTTVPNGGNGLTGSKLGGAGTIN